MAELKFWTFNTIHYSMIYAIFAFNEEHYALTFSNEYNDFYEKKMASEG